MSDSKPELKPARPAAGSRPKSRTRSETAKPAGNPIIPSDRRANHVGRPQKLWMYPISPRILA